MWYWINLTSECTCLCIWPPFNDQSYNCWNCQITLRLSETLLTIPSARYTKREREREREGERERGKERERERGRYYRYKCVCVCGRERERDKERDNRERTHNERSGKGNTNWYFKSSHGIDVFSQHELLKGQMSRHEKSYSTKLIVLFLFPSTTSLLSFLNSLFMMCVLCHTI